MFKKSWIILKIVCLENVSINNQWILQFQYVSTFLSYNKKNLIDFVKSRVCINTIY